MSEPITIVFAVYPRFNHLDLAGPHQILSMVPGANIIVASLEGGEESTDAGLTLCRLTKLRDVERCDVICALGGDGLADALLNEDFFADIRRLGAGARVVTSICTGSLILGAAGLLRGKRAACHWARHRRRRHCGDRFRFPSRRRSRGRDRGAGNSTRPRICAGASIRRGPAGNGVARGPRIGLVEARKAAKSTSRRRSGSRFAFARTYSLERADTALAKVRDIPCRTNPGRRSTAIFPNA
jgi:putative intracellular protease/amidase